MIMLGHSTIDNDLRTLNWFAIGGLYMDRPAVDLIDVNRTIMQGLSPQNTPPRSAA